MADHAREKALSDPQFAPLRDGDPPREVQQLIAEMRQEDWSAHTTHPASVEAVVNRWADELSALLTAAGSSAPPQEWQAGPQVAAEMRHFARLLRSKDVIPTMETMADRLTEWANEIKPKPPGSDRSPTPETKKGKE
jgi:hypothetical protein